MKPATKKILIVGGVGLTAFGLWWWFNHAQAQAQVASHPALAPVSGTSTANGPAPNANVPVAAPVNVPQMQIVSPPAVYTPVAAAPVVTPAPSQVVAPTVAQMYQALVSRWVPYVHNPPPIAMMMPLLTDAQVEGLYNIFTYTWETGSPITPDQVTFWNTIRAQYPALSTGGNGCNNPYCN
jgi:hypothetical protein